MFKRSPRQAMAAVALTLPGLALAACGGPTAGAEPKSSGPVTVKVGQMPIVDSVGFKFAVDKGYFKAEGIEAKADFTNAGAMVTNLVNGSNQFVLGETAILVQAFDKGLPVRIIGVATKTTDQPTEDTGTVLIAKNSPVKTAADLNGRTVAVGALKGGGEISLRAALDKAGADSTKVKFIEMPLPDMTAALTSGRVDAISTISPFDQAALSEGATRLMSPGAEAAPHAMQVAVATTAKFEKEHPNAVKGFLRALAKGTEYAAANPDEVRKVLPQVSPVPPELIAKMKLPVFDTSNPRPSLEVWTRLMEKYNFVSKPVDVDKLAS